MNLISEKSILDIVGWIVVQNQHYYASYHLSYLMVDETLTYYVEYQMIFI